MSISHGHLVLVLGFALHADVLVAVGAHLFPRLVLLGADALLLGFGFHVLKQLSKLVPRARVTINLAGEQGDFVLERREAVRVVQQVLDVARGDGAVAILVILLKGLLELLNREDIHAKS